MVMPRPGLRVGPDDAAFRLDGEAFLHHVLPPGHVVVHGLADDVAGLREAELQRGRGADGPLRIVRRERDAMRVREGGDAARGGESAAVRDVELADLDGALVEHLLEGLEVRHAFAAGDGRGERGVDPGETVDALRPAGFLEEVESIRIERLAELRVPSRVTDARGSPP